MKQRKQLIVYYYEEVVLVLKNDCCIMLQSEQGVQESDTTDVASSNAAMANKKSKAKKAPLTGAFNLIYSYRYYGKLISPVFQHYSKVVRFIGALQFTCYVLCTI